LLHKMSGMLSQLPLDRIPARSELLRQPSGPDNPFIVEEQPQRQERERLGSRRDPDHRRCHKAVERALRRGKLTKPERCELALAGCQTVPLQAHHESYAVGQELVVVWVCKACHDVISSGEWVHRHGKAMAGR